MELWFTEEQAEGVRFSIKAKEHIYSENSEFQKIDVYDTRGFGIVLLIDDFIMCTQKDEFIYHEMITHVPMAVNPLIKNVLIIGGGDGGVVRELTKYESIESIHMVEIDERVVRICEEYLPFTSNKLNDPRVMLYFQDGLEFIKYKKDIYDLIIVDSTDPIGPGEGLFTAEFYKNCYGALTKDGILINQNESPYYINNATEMIRAHKKQKAIFTRSSLYSYNMPTYGSGYWFFGFSSKTLHETKDLNEREWEKLNIKTKYYNTEIHKASFVLPNYVKESIENEKYYFSPNY